MSKQTIIETGTQLVSVNLDKVQSNIFFMNFDNPLLTAQEFCERLYKVTDEEIKHFGNEMPCVIKVFTISNTEVRVVLCCNVTDDDVSAAVKKLQFVIKEFDTKTESITV